MQYEIGHKYFGPFPSASEESRIRLISITPLLPIDRYADFMPMYKDKKGLEKVMAIDQIASVDFEVDGQTFADCPLLRLELLASHFEAMTVWIGLNADPDIQAEATGAAYLALGELNHDPPTRRHRAETHANSVHSPNTE